MKDEITKVEQLPNYLVEAQDKASLDVQINTAKAYPRDIQKAVNTSIFIATLDVDTAKVCGYALPRGNKTIAGPSVHLARILAQNWGNLRVESKVINTTGTEVVSQAICHDLESNYAVKVEVRKKITDKYGKRFNEDMVTMTGSAANAVAYRNAVFNVIPRNVTEKVFQETKNVIVGDLSTEAKLIKRRNDALKLFKDNYGVTEEMIIKRLGVGTVNGIDKDKIVLLLQFYQSLKDGANPSSIFDFEKTPSPKDKKENLKSKVNSKLDLP